MLDNIVNISLKELEEMNEKNKSEWFEENSKKSQLLGISIIPFRPGIGYYIKVDDIEIPENYFKQEFDIIIKNYFAILKKLDEYYKNNKELK
jgi:hypothetical protein